MSPFLIPLGIFAMVVLIVAITNLASIRSREIEIHQSLHKLDMEHRRKMQELEMELERIRQGT